MKTVSARTRPWRLVAAVGSLAVVLLGSGVAAASVIDTERSAEQPPLKSPGAQTIEDLTGAVTADDLARALLGADASISNVSFTGDPRAAGAVSGFGSALGIDNGIALSTGAVRSDSSGAYSSSLAAPNMISDMTAVWGTSGDPDLDQLVAPAVTYDAVTLEFDFTMEATDLNFRFVFGSEEYPSWGGSEFDDAFAFYLDGTNCATVPDPDGSDGLAPVSVATVNKTANAALFRSNAQSDDPPTPIDTELGGVTVPLTCAVYVAPEITHHLKLVIADTGDAQWDSAVVIEGGTTEPNEKPVAEDQSVTAYIAMTTEITLSGSDGDGDPLTFAIGAEPAHGRLEGEPPVVFYTPDEGYTGVDSFTFTVNDGLETSVPGNVAILVTDQTQSPSEPPPSSPPPSDDPSSPPPTTEDAPFSPPPTTESTETTDSDGSGSSDDEGFATTAVRSQGGGSGSSGKTTTSSTRPGALSHTGVPTSTPWLGAAGISGALAGVILIMTARRRLAR
jgi:hypothetical protein